MTSQTPQQEFLSKCQKSVTFFIEACVKLQHPSIGIMPFKLFGYQKNCLKQYREHRFNIFLKCRQSGISTLSGAYALWFAMFHGNKKVLIVSKRDLDAKDFLAKNVQLAYDYLPEWMKAIWPLEVKNEHELGFTNGSLIRSLTASGETLRSNASSLNIIDESAFINDMDTMWAGGWSTLQHGGSVIVISTPNGVGNWYWSTWTEAIDKLNDFNPIRINWWDMDWHLEYVDQVRKKKVRIAPTDGIRPCTTKEDIEKYGDFWSPWLESEYRGLQRKGESHKFRQEVLAEFIGSGGTILSNIAIKRLGRIVAGFAENFSRTTEPIQYINPATGEVEYLDMRGVEANEGLWVWQEPVRPVEAIMKGTRIIRPGVPGHTYVMGVDVATGRNNDYSAIVILDVDEQEEVAEFMGRVQPNIFCKFIDYLGRLYNNAFTCVDRTGIGADLIEDLVELQYTNLWRKIKHLPDGNQVGPYGFAITDSSKPTLNKALIQHIAEDEDQGYLIKSTRIYKQSQIYIRKRTSRGEDTGRIGAQNGRGNYDDLITAVGLAFIAVGDLSDLDPRSLIPTKSNQVDGPDLSVTDRAAHQKQLVSSSIGQRNDPHVMLPYTQLTGMPVQQSIDQELSRFTDQLAITQSRSQEMLRREIPVLACSHRTVQATNKTNKPIIVVARRRPSL